MPDKKPDPNKVILTEPKDGESKEEQARLRRAN